MPPLRIQTVPLGRGISTEAEPGVFPCGRESVASWPFCGEISLVDPGTTEMLARMERDWDARAREAPEFYIATARTGWSMDEFFRSGEVNVENEILADADFLFGKLEYRRLRVLEIGCGSGRMTRALAAVFGEVDAVDISSEMIALARRNLDSITNVRLHKNNGADLAGLPPEHYDFAFSFIVFQHIPDRGIIESYVRDVYRCLKRGAVFKFQAQGDTNIQTKTADSWVGVPMSLADAQDLAGRCGFELLRSSGEGSQYFWLWFLKPKWPWMPRAILRLARRIRAWVETHLAKPVTVTFSAPAVRAGEGYRVRIHDLAGQQIDIGYEFQPEGQGKPVAGVVSRWCELDGNGEAPIAVPPEHPAGLVRITKVRSRTTAGRWYHARGDIQVVR